MEWERCPLISSWSWSAGRRRPPSLGGLARSTDVRPSRASCALGAGALGPWVREEFAQINGRVTFRYNSRLHHLGLGRRHATVRVLILVADLDVRVIKEDGELLRTLRLDPSRDYQAQERT
jgi:hypothetical protein